MNSQHLPSSFERLIASHDKPILVDFWAAWCAPCRMIAPVIQELAKEFRGQLTVVKINVDEKPAIAGRYGIQSIPTLMLFKHGRSVWRKSGTLSLDVLRREITPYLGGATLQG
jgi:thioredoxin